jgi:uncharacterized SAM-binding protein YcdF (DUF218 family)
VFYLKKLIASFFQPLSILLMGVGIALFFYLRKDYKKTKIFLTLSLFWFTLISTNIFSNALLLPLEYQYPKLDSVKKDIKYILVLGSSHRSDHNIPINSQISKTGLVRLSEGIRLYKKSSHVKLIFSGYNGLRGDKNSHALIQKKTALSLGIDPSDMILQTKPKDTKEEAINVKKIIGHSKFILVTSASHMPRAMEIFHSIGLKPIAAPTNFISSKELPSVSFFSAGSIVHTQIAFHEYLGIIWHRIILAYNILINKREL